MKLKYISILLFASLFWSCENNEPVIDANNLLIGFWAEPSYDGETTTFKRNNSLPNEAYGVSFTKNGDFIERSSGFCGTPPLTFSDYKGDFTLEETLIKVNTQSYPTFFQWRILKLTEDELIVKRELSEQEIEHRNLMDLFSEIQSLSYSTYCYDASNWTFVAYGAKACGGPQGYIAYSTKIDTVAFLKKVENYTKTEKEFNIKWGVISDCSVVNPPKKVECKNGYPSLIY